MSGPFGSSQWMYNAGGGFYDYSIDGSLRFNADDSAYLNRTAASTGSLTTATISAWVKRARLGTEQRIFTSTKTGVDSTVYFDSSGRLGFYVQQSNGNYDWKRSTALHRDVSAWYHIVAVWDSSNATAADRMRLYVNGERITNFFSNINPALNDGVAFFDSTCTHYIGRYTTGGLFWDGYLAEVNAIDGTALDPTSFGETKSGVWIPKAYGGSYGTNGFHLEFDGNTNDSSGNGNNFTANNISTSDYVPDSPTNNFATWSYLSSTNLTYTVTQDGNLKANMGTGTGTGLTGTFSCKGGKWYWEIRASNVGNGLSLGITTGSGTTSDMNTKGIFYDIYGNKRVFGTTTGSAGATFAANDIIGMAVDAESAGTIAFYKNNALQFTVTESSILTEDFLPWILNNSSSAGSLSYVNFGQDSTFSGAITAGGNSDANGMGDFKYSVPSGFLALCSANLPEPVVGPLGDSLSGENFNTVLYTGNGVQDTTISGVGFQPDWVWIKDRTGPNHHILFDSVRGGTKQLFSSLANSEQTNTDLTNGFASDGFIVGDNVTGTGATNLNTNTYVSWNWKAGGSASSNTDGYYTSTVSANPDSGFSIIKWTGDGTAGGTVGHGLTKAPELWISRRINTTDNWLTYFTVVDGSLDYMYLNLTNGASGSGITLPTSTVFSDGLSSGTSDDRICYAFHSVEGYSKVGSHKGNGSTNGPFIYTGFRPRWVLMKQTSGLSNWWIWDTARETYNQMSTPLFPDEPFTEASNVAYQIDILSNGFKMRYNNSTVNGNGLTYIHLAFAENPFKYANAR